MSMTSARNRNRYFSLAAAVLAAAGLAACGGSTSSSPAAKGGGASSTGTPVSGGTLKIIAASGPDHIDPVSAYYTADYELLRAYTRQLVA
jgi:peptide/nickel transport system substrate-binding protein